MGRADDSSALAIEEPTDDGNTRATCRRPGASSAPEGGPSESAAATSGHLADSFGRRITYLRLAITEYCNLRCTYCRPAEIAGVASLPPSLTREEIVRMASVFVGLGVQKIRLTGGEPTLHPELVGIVEQLAGLRPVPPLLALTTNGILLARLAEPLRRAGLARVNISLDSISTDGFRRMTGSRRLEDVRKGIDAAIEAGFERVKINAVILAGENEDEILPLANLARDLPVDVRFIEYMPIAGSGWNRQAHLPAEEIERRLSLALDLSPASKDSHSGPARMVNAAGFSGQIGFISPLSVPFCSDCNRVRVTARGTLRLCLLGGGEVDLVDPIRRGAGDRELADLIGQALAGKAERHSVRLDSLSPPTECGSPMWAVGG